MLISVWHSVSQIPSSTESIWWCYFGSPLFSICVLPQLESSHLRPASVNVRWACCTTLERKLGYSPTKTLKMFLTGASISFDDMNFEVKAVWLCRWISRELWNTVFVSCTQT